MAGRQTGGRARALAFLGLSFFAALFVALIVYQMFQSFQQELVAVQTVEETVQVVVAAHDMHQGRTIAEQDLVLTEMPLNFISPGVLRESTEAVGRTARERILQGEFIRKERLAVPEAGSGMTAIIPRGMRAIKLDISGGSAVSGFLNPGNYVDVIVTVEAEDGEKAQTNTILQSIEVLAVNTRMGASTNESSNNQQSKPRKVRPAVTLAVTPDQAEDVVQAKGEGTVTLTLRNDIDVTEIESHGVLSKDLLGGASDTQRISVTEYTRSTQSQSSDGSIVVIRASDETVERVSN